MCSTTIMARKISIKIAPVWRTEKDGSNTLAIRVREGRDFYKFYYTNIRVQKKFWDNIKELCTSLHNHYEILNEGLVP